MASSSVVSGDFGGGDDNLSGEICFVGPDSFSNWAAKLDTLRDCRSFNFGFGGDCGFEGGLSGILLGFGIFGLGLVTFGGGIFFKVEALDSRSTDFSDFSDSSGLLFSGSAVGFSSTVSFLSSPPVFSTGLARLSASAATSFTRSALRAPRGIATSILWRISFRSTTRSKLGSKSGVSLAIACTYLLQTPYSSNKRKQR
ncbi:hypothetical protein OGAPHI_006621 [Ogataea philodendri]|uniref:Uncharacterized protein n=1 Tax=Ogataea philodendri TaxID=1378263 RepID=A0A9P8NY67_9ASCO|nr:uncharacterized protein OGAPHI_006621 [Ogataea philodendri]KAH3661214.1 hypothetical protein OGAPHI_006621 [Ogataea philodendri]